MKTIALRRSPIGWHRLFYALFLIIFLSSIFISQSKTQSTSHLAITIFVELLNICRNLNELTNKWWWKWSVRFKCTRLGLVHTAHTDAHTRVAPKWATNLSFQMIHLVCFVFCLHSKNKLWLQNFVLHFTLGADAYQRNEAKTNEEITKEETARATWNARFRQNTITIVTYYSNTYIGIRPLADWGGDWEIV